MSTSGDESFTAYDELIYVTKNTDTILVKNKQASDVISSQFKKFGVAIGKIQPTGHKIKKLLLDNKTLADIVTDCLAETKRYTGKSYKLYSVKGKTYLVSRDKTAISTVTISNLISGSSERSIEELRNQVVITKGSLDVPPSKTPNTRKKPLSAAALKTKAAQDAKDIRDAKFVRHIEHSHSSMSKYGLMQHIESVDDKTTLAQMKAKAKSLLKELNVVETTVDIDFIGNVGCLSGRIIHIYDDLSNISGKYYISSDSHSFSGGSHKMSLQLSRKLQ